jgi:hypothetical protein
VLIERRAIEVHVVAAVCVAERFAHVTHWPFPLRARVPGRCDLSLGCVDQRRTGLQLGNHRIDRRSFGDEFFVPRRETMPLRRSIRRFRPLRLPKVRTDQVPYL